MTKKKAHTYEELLNAASTAGATEGFDDLNMDVMAFPFLRVVQDLSPVTKKAKAEYNPEAEPGMIYNTITGRLFTTPLQFVVGRFERYYIEWKPNRGGFVAAHTPALVESNPHLVHDGLKITDPVTGNDFMDTYVYYVWLPEHPEEAVCLLSLSSTQLKAAKKLNRQMATTFIPGTTVRAKPYFMVWELNTHFVSNPKGEWFSVDFKLESLVTPEQLTEIEYCRTEMNPSRLDLKALEAPMGRSAGAPRDNEVQY